MGIYLNPGNEAFAEIRDGLYVDKTGLVGYINNTINRTPDRFTCFTRPRRFGKTFAAQMLCAYYDKSCDSRELFRDLEISQLPSFETHLNKYNVIYIDVTWFTGKYRNMTDIVDRIQSDIIKELLISFPNVADPEEMSLAMALANVAEATGQKFIIIIDEWDALFRESKDDEKVQKEYIQLLRSLFKGGVITSKTIAAAFMTGILPIKKYGTESALTDFQEFTMAEPFKLAKYIGFTECEVKHLCELYGADFNELKNWYDGYSFSEETHVYNPNSVIKALKNNKIVSYWSTTESYESLKDYITLNLDGLRDVIIRMLGGQRQKVNVRYFNNDLTTLISRDNVLALLIHLGYLAYDDQTREAYIPNKEVSEAFEIAIQDSGWNVIAGTLVESENLLNNTLSGNESAVEEALEAIHESESSVLKYNDENSLACTINLAYYTARQYYEIVREFPSGKGFADVVFLPRKGVNKPAIIIELKVDKTADAAIKQIKENRYYRKLDGYGAEILLVGINYSRETKKHECTIEKWNVKTIARD